MIRRSILAATCALILSAAWSTAQAPVIRNPHNPPLFQRFAAPVSGPIRFLLSDHGLSLVRRSKSPVAIAVLKALGEPLPAASGYPAAIPPDSLFSQPEAAFDANVAGQLATASSQACRSRKRRWSADAVRTAPCSIWNRQSTPHPRTASRWTSFITGLPRAPT